jgi:DNA/RNA endonuclease YhcR with UshA esterase domain
MKNVISLTNLCILATVLLTAALRAQTPSIVPDAEASQHIGQNVTVEGIVTAVSTSRKGNTFINFGGAYPNQTFTGWIPAGTPLASDESLHALQGKDVKITGKIDIYHGKPEIKILTKDQIVAE